MSFLSKKIFTGRIILITSFLIIVLILWNAYSFFQIFKKEERLKMTIWANAQKSLVKANNDTDVELLLKIFSTNTSIPIILTENDVVVSTVNIDEKIVKNNQEIKKHLAELRAENAPIVIEYAEGKYQQLNYGNSSILTKLKYYPPVVMLIMVFFGLLIYNYYRNIKIVYQNKLWVGMAKETAHQIGTPLSSLMGWLELLKEENTEKKITAEIEKDIHRLQNIIERFSRIGSVPILEEKDIIYETKQAVDYLQFRVSKRIKFFFEAPPEPIFISINTVLYAWTIENLIKNSIDAMENETGKITIRIENEVANVKINIIDTGRGILKNQFKRIFEPGFTTKKRGWGLGLSLSKRIIEEYHKGKIRVLSSEKGKGTTIQVLLIKKEA